MLVADLTCRGPVDVPARAVHPNDGLHCGIVRWVVNAAPVDVWAMFGIVEQLADPPLKWCAVVALTQVVNCGCEPKEVSPAVVALYLTEFISRP